MKLGIVADRPFSYIYILSYKSVNPHVKSHNLMPFGRRNGRRFDIENQSPTHFNLFMIRLQNSADKNPFDSNKQQISIL